jgi:hypothetical protein
MSKRKYEKQISFAFTKIDPLEDFERELVKFRYSFEVHYAYLGGMVTVFFKKDENKKDLIKRYRQSLYS